jgi:hypothetical protein
MSLGTAGRSGAAQRSDREAPTLAPPQRPRQRTPEPAWLWVRYAPRRWPPPARPWTDLAHGRLGAAPGDRGTAPAGPPLADLAGAPLDDVVWLPPVAAEHAAERDRVAATHRDRGTPVLVQVLPGDAVPPALSEAGAVVLHDLLPALLTGDLAALASLPAGAVALWPLVAGRTDDAALWEEGCAALAAAGTAVVQTVLPRLTPADRRRLAEDAAESAFHRLFHGPEPDERAFARVAAAHGLASFLRRPLPTPPRVGAAGRRIAGALHLAAELWLRLGRAPSQGQAFFRAARWIDASGYDPAALARDGNLGVVETLDDASRRFIEEAAETDGDPPLLAELIADYRAPHSESPSASAPLPTDPAAERNDP